MANKWNLTPTEWSDVLLSGLSPETVASDLAKGKVLPWTPTLVKLTADSKRILDLGSGRGNHSAVLALNGKETTLLDWSKENVNFSERLFALMNLEGRFYQADMMKPLPFETNSFDTVFSCGVFEYFTSETIRGILAEALRVSKKRGIIMVPNALSIAYRIGMWHMKQTGQWQWGGEVPSYTLKPYFRGLSNLRVFEFSVGARISLDFLTMLGGGAIKKLCTRLLNLRDHPNPTLFRQGYLLVTIAERTSE